jgi:hypothetical protein
MRFRKLPAQKKNSAGWRTIGGIRFYARSKWEANYARYLEFLKRQGEILLWEHEAETFWFDDIKRGVRSYLPDFRVTYPDYRVEHHEVKGWMDPKSATKLKRMAKYHPGATVILIGKEWFKRTGTLRAIIKDWE